MLHSTMKVVSSSARKNACLSFESLVKKAVSEAVAKQRALGLPNYYVKDGRVYGRDTHGRFVTTKR